MKVGTKNQHITVPCSTFYPDVSGKCTVPLASSIFSVILPVVSSDGDGGCSVLVSTTQR